MRLDKWLKVSRLIKRRTVAQMACDQHRVFINDKIAKSATTIKAGDKVHLELGSRAITASVLIVPKGAVPAQDASKLYEITEEIKRAPEVLEWLSEHERLSASEDEDGEDGDDDEDN
ncbi:MAG: RNA-binding S4 domain-containing protein [Candidatus Obscuribacterales bacterium]|nr:RNA-binding S4 domain-containing protein [Candidatus Obscuribacterales bacterium]